MLKKVIVGVDGDPVDYNGGELISYKYITSIDSSETLSTINKDSLNNSRLVILTQFERMQAIIGAYKNGHVTTIQANSLIEERCPGFFDWRIK